MEYVYTELHSVISRDLGVETHTSTSLLRIPFPILRPEDVQRLCIELQPLHVVPTKELVFPTMALLSR